MMVVSAKIRLALASEGIPEEGVTSSLSRTLISRISNARQSRVGSSLGHNAVVRQHRSAHPCRPFRIMV